jgi:hypothetical protein
MVLVFRKLYLNQQTDWVKLKCHSDRKKATSPKGMEEYIWLEWITVLLHLCSMQ